MQSSIISSTTWKQMVEVCAVLETAETFQTFLSCSFPVQSSKDPSENMCEQHTAWQGHRQGHSLRFQLFPLSEMCFQFFWALSPQGGSLPTSPKALPNPTRATAQGKGFSAEGKIRVSRQRITETISKSSLCSHPLCSLGCHPGRLANVNVNDNVNINV